MSINYSRGRNKFDNKPDQRQCADFETFEQAVLNDISQAKGQAFICSPLALGHHYQKPNEYPGIDHWRLKDYSLPRKFFAFDLDGFSDPSVLQQVKGFASQYRCFGYTTASHTDDAPRARLIMETNRPMTRDECETASVTLEQAIALAVIPGKVAFDQSVYRGEQPIYTPVVGADTFHFDGAPVDVDMILGVASRLNRTQTLNLGSGSGFTLPSSVADGEGRESTILSYAGKLRASGFDQQSIDRACLDYNRCNITPPLDNDEVLDRARRYEEDTTGATIAGDTYGWTDPEPIKDTLPPVLPFHCGLLPKGVRDHVVDVADRMCCPVEFPAVGAMVTLAAAIGSRVYCKPYEKDNWMGPAGAWGMLIARPSQLKTPPLSEMLRPLKILDAEAADQFKLVEEQYKFDKAVYDNKFRAAAKKGLTNPGVPVPVEPKRLQFIVNDTSYEQMIVIAGANPNGVLMYRDELVGWLHSLNKDNQKEAKGMYLTGWTGTEGYNTDRIGRGHVRAEHLNISVLGTIQPGVLKTIVNSAFAGGDGDDGLIQRFQFAVYPDQVAKFVKVDRYPNFQAQQVYEDQVKALTALDLQAVGAQFTPDGKAYLHFDDEGQQVFEDWRQELEDRLRDPNSDETPTMLAHLGKYRSLFPKIALVLHLAEGGVGPIGKRCAVRAKAWTMLLERHARRMYHTATNRVLQSAGSLANKIKAAKLKDGFTRSDVMLKQWASLRTADEVRSALDVLVDLNWLKSVEDKSTGGRPTQRYLINAKLSAEGADAA